MPNQADTRNPSAVQHRLSWGDDRECPKWAPGPDGHMVNIEQDERLPGLFDVWRADACEHQNAVIVQLQTSNGGVQYKWRCSHCGFKLSTALAHAKVNPQFLTDLPPEHFDEIEQRYFTQRTAHLDKLASDAAERCQEPRRAEYAAYRRTPRWKALCAKVRRRAAGVCEGCLEAPVYDVHHTSYKHLYNEFAFELIALCRPCHDRWHGG